MKGQLVKYDERKGYGFIESESGKLCFVHYTQIKSKLNIGDQVEFECYEAQLGYEAKEVSKV